MIAGLSAWILVPIAASVVLIISGTAKLGTTAAIQGAMEQFGLPGVLRSRIAALALPFVEIGLGVAGLVAGGWAGQAVFLLQALLYLLFAIIVARSVIQGDPVDCHCFGSRDADPVSWLTVARNVALTALAAASVFVASAGSVVSRLWRFDASDWGWATGLALFAVVLYVSSSVRNRERDERAAAIARRDLAVQGQLHAPDFPVEDRGGATSTLAGVLGERATLVLRVSPACGACRRVVQLAPEWQQRLGEAVRVVLLISGNHEEFFGIYPEFALPVHKAAYGDMKDLGLTSTPSGVLVGSNGKLASGTVIGSGMLGNLVDDLEAVLTP
ncbi:MAG TPA: MauE/DoxX family redox-associated membrane protein [Arachnia sp.]|nr:MauE/DoxX family redox-associated membrane protein [Arachnia sp.]HMT85155.1 MauE/DoxX family redox-associated membrane protein [Arachnia sp.]